MIQKIGLKLIIVVGLTALLIIGIYSIFNIKFQNDVLLNEVERHSNQLSETIKHSTRYDMLSNRREHISNIVATIGEEPCIREVQILNKQGMVVYSADSSDIGNVVEYESDMCQLCHFSDEALHEIPINARTRIFRMHPDSGRVLGMISPIYNDKSCSDADCHAHDAKQKVLGILDVTICLKDVDENVYESEIKMVIFALISFLSISFIIGFFVKRWVDKPVNILVKATQQVASGNLNYSITDTRNDELGKLAVSFNNMTKRLSEARLQLFQSDKMASLGRLAAGVAHEINNPLTGVLTYSSFLLKRTQNQPEIQEDLKVIVRETKRSREIVKSLLDFARQSVPKKSPANLNDIIDKAAEVVANQLSLNKIQLIKSLDPNLPFTIVDSNQIQQVMINLMVNASDAIGKRGGEIRIETSVIVLPPYGVAQIRNAQCPKRHDLIDQKFKIEGNPSVKLKAEYKGKVGYLNLDPVYGKNRNTYEIELEDYEEVDLFCPECGISVIEKELKCPKCGGKVYKLHTPGDGDFEGCSRKGCDWQRWEKIDAEGQKQFINVSVSDDGCGIPKDELHKIFEPFYSTKGQKGTGLGLAVIWGIIDNHNGSITVESEVGKGTTFKINIPLTKRPKFNS